MTQSKRVTLQRVPVLSDPHCFPFCLFASSLFTVTLLHVIDARLTIIAIFCKKNDKIKYDLLEIFIERNNVIKIEIFRVINRWKYGVTWRISWFSDTYHHFRYLFEYFAFSPPKLSLIYRHSPRQFGFPARYYYLLVQNFSNYHPD